MTFSFFAHPPSHLFADVIIESNNIVMNDLFQFEALKLVRNVLKVQCVEIRNWKMFLI